MIRFLPVIIFFIVCLIFALLIWQKPESNTLPSPLIGKSFPQISLPTLISEKENPLDQVIQEQVTIVNIFASWCLPCLSEHPLWTGILQETKVNLVGIAWRDKPEQVSAWLHKYGNPYTHIFVDMPGKTTVDLGITGVPETYIVDKKGVVRMKLSAPLDQTIIENELLPLINQLQAE